MRVATSPVPATTSTQAVSTSDLLNKVANWDRWRPHDISQVLNAAFDANDYPDCIRDLRARNIDPFLYIESLDMIIDSFQADSDLRRRCLQALQETCGTYGIPPTSYIVPFTLAEIEDQLPFAAGDSSCVWRLTDERDRVFAVKGPLAGQQDPEKFDKRFFREVIFSKRARHPNILSIEGVVQGLLPGSEFCMVSRWMENGTVLDYVKRCPGANCLELLIGVTRGLSYLHGNGVVHGDLKSSNILVDSKGIPCLSNFGLCSITTKVESANAPAPCNRRTIRYYAPELLPIEKWARVLRRKPTGKSDVYSLSMVIVELVTGQEPFPDYWDDQVPVKVLKGKRPKKPDYFDAPGISPGVWKIAKQCWRAGEKERPETGVVLQCLETLLHSAFSNRDSVAMPELIAQPQSPEDSGPEPESWEADLTDFLRAYRTWDQDQHRETALLFVERLSEALEKTDLCAQQRKRYLRYLRRLCTTFYMLPSLFVLPATSLERESTLFARGGFGDLYKGTLNGSPVVIKTLRVEPQIDLKKFHGLLIKEVVRWKWLRHDNIIPFLGVSLDPPLFSVVSDRMEHGSIMNFIKLQPSFNRLRLLVGAVSGLKHLHDHGIIHGDLKGANILVDSTCCARLADFGLAAAVDESVTGSANTSRATRGTPRWMAPELIDPDLFGFTGQYLKQLPSVSTDIYAMAMTIFEVLTGCRPFNDYHSVSAVTNSVTRGERPGRPPSGFTDELWQMLMASWVEERAWKPQKRLALPAMLDRLRESVEQWEKLIVPLTPNKWKENIPNAGSTIASLVEPGGKDKTIKRRHSSPRITNMFKALLRRGRDVQET